LRSPSSSNLLVGIVGSAIILGGFFGCSSSSDQAETRPQVTSTPTPSATESAIPEPTPSQSEQTQSLASQAISALASIPIKGRAPKTGYDRDLFSSDWDYSFGCDTRNKILRRDFSEFAFRAGSSCIIETGVLNDPYTGTTINFVRGVGTSSEVQIDHVVAVSDAWQKGAQQLSSDLRYAFYNDPLNLLAVSGSANAQKSDSDAASWLPPNKSFRCDFVARQIAVKLSYNLWVTQAEYDSMYRVLEACPNQTLPTN
jgi:hypothetical protein